MEKTSTRIDIVDALRGLSVMSILILHCLFHFNYFIFPENESTSWLNTSDNFIYFFFSYSFAGKAKGIFSILFGLSFFIQNNNQIKKGKDFTFRFLWRLLILAILGVFNGTFYNGDILFLFASIGIFLPIISRFKTKPLITLAAFMLLFNPIMWARAILPIVGWDHVIFDHNVLLHPIGEVLAEGNLFDTSVANFKYVPSNILVQTWFSGLSLTILALFIVGIIIGRKKVFIYSDKNIKNWKIVTFISAIFSFSLYAIVLYTRTLPTNNTITLLQPILSHYCDMATMVYIMGLFVLIYYKTQKGHHTLEKFIPYGKMSLTNYISQSIIGAFIFYPWGLNLSPKLGFTYSFLVAICIFIVQYTFCYWWLKYNKQGPIEHLWKKATWIKLPKISLSKNEIKE